jgi:hypothetical protein
MKKLSGVFYAERFLKYEVPYGGLPKGEIAAHALFRYYTIARSNWERVNTQIRYEDEREDVINYRQLMSSIATMYNTTPERMVKFWPAVDWTCTMHSLPKLPDEERYRMNRTIVVQ